MTGALVQNPKLCLYISRIVADIEPRPLPACAPRGKPSNNVQFQELLKNCDCGVRPAKFINRSVNRVPASCQVCRLQSFVHIVVALLQLLLQLSPSSLCFLYFAQLATGQIKKYVKRGVDLSAKNKLGDTPLHEVMYGLALRRRGKRIEALKCTRVK